MPRVKECRRRLLWWWSACLAVSIRQYRPRRLLGGHLLHWGSLAFGFGFVHRHWVCHYGGSDVLQDVLRCIDAIRAVLHGRIMLNGVICHTGRDVSVFNQCQLPGQRWYMFRYDRLERCSVQLHLPNVGRYPFWPCTFEPDGQPRVLHFQRLHGQFGGNLPCIVHGLCRFWGWYILQDLLRSVDTIHAILLGQWLLNDDDCHRGPGVFIPNECQLPGQRWYLFRYDRFSGRRVPLHLLIFGRYQYGSVSACLAVSICWSILRLHFASGRVMLRSYQLH